MGGRSQAGELATPVRASQRQRDRRRRAMACEMARRRQPNAMATRSPSTERRVAMRGSGRPSAIVQPLDRPARPGRPRHPPAPGRSPANSSFTAGRGRKRFGPSSTRSSTSSTLESGWSAPRGMAREYIDRHARPERAAAHRRRAPAALPRRARDAGQHRLRLVHARGGQPGRGPRGRCARASSARRSSASPTIRPTAGRSSATSSSVASPATARDCCSSATWTPSSSRERLPRGRIGPAATARPARA